jgi:hypothetical protein
MAQEPVISQRPSIFCPRISLQLDVAYWHETDLAVQSPHNDASLSIRRPAAAARAGRRRAVEGYRE